MKRFFGTDGIRGRAGSPPLDAATVRRFGAALHDVVREATTGAPRIVIGRDTRESGPWILDAIASGIASRGGASVDAGVLTTPALALSTRVGMFDAGVMISASHNPFQDNGLKVFGPDGMKLPDVEEERVESAMLDGTLDDPGEGAGRALQDGSLVRRYVGFLEAAVPPGRFRGLRVLLDCAHGAAAGIAEEVFRHYGADVAAIGNLPNGRNINLNCGSLHLEGLAGAVSGAGFDIGIAFDGDADRCLAVDRRGRVVDGDRILYLVARKMKRDGILNGDCVVATIMSNFWLEKRLRDEGITLVRTPVGDKYVLERMIAEDASLGGEQSGHIIVRDRTTTGDGLLTGLLLLDTILDGPESLEDTLDGIVPSPQVLVNVRVREKPDLRAHPVIGPAVVETERRVAGSGRVVLRYSGTEPLARVMIEGSDADEVARLAAELAETIRSAIGAT